MYPLICLHGALGSKKQFNQFHKRFADHIEVHSFNFSGHGGEPPAKDFSIRRFAEELHTYLHENRLEKVNLFGYSMGGYIAVFFAYLYPDKVNKIITLGTKWDWNPESATNEVKKLNPDIIQQKVPRFAESLQKTHAPNDWKMIMEKTSNMLIALGNSPDITPEILKNISHNILVCLGDSDKMVTIEETVFTFRNLNNAAWCVLPGTRHPIETISTNVFWTAVYDFLELNEK